MTLKLIPLFATTAVAITTGPRLVRADAAPPPTHQLDVEVHDRDRAKHDNIAHLALFVREGSMAAVETRVGDDFYKLRVTPHGGWIELSLERRSGPARGVPDLTVQTVREVAPGARAVLAAAEGPDGGRTEVVLTMK